MCASIAHPFFSNPDDYAEYCTDRMTSEDIVKMYRKMQSLEPWEELPTFDEMLFNVYQYLISAYYAEE